MNGKRSNGNNGKRSIQIKHNGYPCTGCGLCCRQLAAVLEHFKKLVPGDRYYKEFREFPYLPDASGSCPQLQPDNSCGVYLDRPSLCDSRKLYDIYFAGEETLLEYDLNQRNVCNHLIREAGLPADNLVVIKIDDYD